jgi:uncharacterized protein (TIGR02301 family)
VPPRLRRRVLRRHLLAGLRATSAGETGGPRRATGAGAGGRTAAAYEPQLLRLAELMGALAYLRDLCGAHDAEAFHAKMASLLEVEARSQTRKESLAGAYNNGFRGYELSYRVCTPAAREIIARFLDEAGKISTDVANRYGG